jgi:uncharacterized protein
MRPRRAAAAPAALAAACAGLLAACASQPDDFYTLRAVPDVVPAPRPAITTQVALGISIPAVADRREMILGGDGDRVAILEHERWAAPLSELIAQTLGLDIERRRPDMLVAGRTFDRSRSSVRVNIDIVRLAARAAGDVTLEAHWRIVDERSKTDEVGAEVLTAPVEGGGYAAVAQALSAALGSLADRVAAKLPVR